MYESSRIHIWTREGVGRIGSDAPDAHLADLIDPDDPAFPDIMHAVMEFKLSGVEMSEQTVRMAIQIGQHKNQRRDRERPPVVTPGTHAPVVYYIRRGAMVKIGTTTNMRMRMAVLLPEEILATEPGGYELEAKRHREFRELRIDKREWFHAGAKLQQHILHLRDLHGIPDPTLPVLSGS